MSNTKQRKKSLLFAGIILLALAIGAAVMLFLKRYPDLHIWVWYSGIRKQLITLEAKIADIGMGNATRPGRYWEFVLVIMILYVVKSFFPIYFTSTVCFLTGVVFPVYISLPINLIGVIIQFTIKYYWGVRFGAGYAWKLVSKSEDLRRLIQSKGKGNTGLLCALRAIPGTPVNIISAIYGSFNFGYRKFLLLSIFGYLPRLFIFTVAGSNMFDPLSTGFLVPMMMITFMTGVTCLGANGIWTIVNKLTGKNISIRETENTEISEEVNTDD